MHHLIHDIQYINMIYIIYNMIYTVYTVLYICLFVDFKLHCFVRTFVFSSYLLHLHILYKIAVQSY